MTDDLVDLSYLADMRHGLEATAFHTLTAQAEDNFTLLLAELTTAWRNQDDVALGEAAHRLKGAAASIGCVALAARAHALLTTPRPATTLSVSELEGLRQLCRQSTTLLHQVSAQEQLMPVPPNPQ